MDRQEVDLYNARAQLRNTIESLVQANGNNTHDDDDVYAIINSDDFTRLCRAACRCPKAAALPSFVACLKRMIASHAASASKLDPTFVALDIMGNISKVLDTEIVSAPNQEQHTSFDDDSGIDYHADHNPLTSTPHAFVRHTPAHLHGQQAASGGKNGSTPVGPPGALPLPADGTMVGAIGVEQHTAKDGNALSTATPLPSPQTPTEAEPRAGLRMRATGEPTIDDPIEISVR